VWEVRLWDVPTGKPGRLLYKYPPDEWFGSIAFSPDGRLVATGGKKKHGIHIWDASNGTEVRHIKDVSNEGGSLCFSPDSKALACGKSLEPRGPDGRTLYMWDVASGKERVQFDLSVSWREAYHGTPLAFSPDGRILASVSGEWERTMVRLWNTASGKELCRHKGHREWVGSIAFSPDGKLVASGSGFNGAKDSSVHVWEAATGRLIRRFEGHHSCVSALMFSSDGLTVASGAGDSTILLWDITGRRPDGRWHVKPLSSRQLDASWSALANADAAKAYDAVWAFGATPEKAVPFLRKHLTPARPPDAKLVAQRIAELDSDEFTVRQKAAEELDKFGDVITPALQQALEDKPSLEKRQRIRQLLDQSREWTPEHLRAHRAIQALEHIGSRQAKELLQALAEGTPEARRTAEAKAALERMSR